jgi:squalene-hopene/tetraprenyl-beta-curcumene cyclase
VQPLVDASRFQNAFQRVQEHLFAARNPAGHWEGVLSSSALSTATAVTALAVVQTQTGLSTFQAQIKKGLEWLSENVNADGGWGDTIRSVSNLSTTTLCWAAFGAAQGAAMPFQKTIANAERWLTQNVGGIEPDRLAPAVIARYGKDRTFSVPILTMCALAGRLGAGPKAWKHVIPLPFELAAFPHRMFSALRLPVVSYALPALIAIGQAHHYHSPSRNPLARILRGATRRKTLKKLTEIQPSNGGFLEATPLTSFVTMSLAGSGEAGHVVVKRGVEFLSTSQREDGSWPIDTNLATWVTTLSVNALGAEAARRDESGANKVGSWLLNQQYRQRHPYTYASPGGWAWTDLPGGVPDADDTAGALLALHNLGVQNEQAREAAALGVEWLLNVQNSDGGIPTFCRGWGALPFDHSSADITAHAIRAWLEWMDQLSLPLRTRTERALHRALRFLCRTQRSDGSWVPLWFGNQFAPDDENPTYGTARVLSALAHSSCGRCEGIPLAIQKATRWLVMAQNGDGSWGGYTRGQSSIEETALAIEALAEAPSENDNGVREALGKGVNWLLEQIESGAWLQPSPIGFYFAKLWYYEELYPIIFTAGALRAVKRACGEAMGR